MIECRHYFTGRQPAERLTERSQRIQCHSRLSVTQPDKQIDYEKTDLEISQQAYHESRFIDIGLCAAACTNKLPYSSVEPHARRRGRLTPQSLRLECCAPPLCRSIDRTPFCMHCFCNDDAHYDEIHAIFFAVSDCSAASCHV